MSICCLFLVLQMGQYISMKFFFQYIRVFMLLKFTTNSLFSLPDLTELLIFWVLVSSICIMTVLLQLGHCIFSYVGLPPCPTYLLPFSYPFIETMISWHLVQYIDPILFP